MRRDLLQLRIDPYTMFSERIEAHLRYGFRRIYKHREQAPDQADIEEQITALLHEVMNGVCELVDFEAFNKEP